MSTSKPARVTKQKTAKQSRTTVNPVGHPSVFSAGDKLSDNLNPSSLFAQDTSRTTGGIEQPSALDFNLSSSSASDASHTSGSKDHPSALELSLSSMLHGKRSRADKLHFTAATVSGPKPPTMLLLPTFISYRHQNGIRKILSTTLLCCCKPAKMDVKMRCFIPSRNINF